MEKKWSHFFKEQCFKYLCFFGALLPLSILLLLLVNIFSDGLPRLTFSFLSSYPSRKAELAGILPSLVGSFSLITLTIFIAIPLGIFSALYLEEYSKKGKFSNFIEMNLTSLAGVPSVIYGLLGLGIFVRLLHFDRSLLAGACTLALLILPIIIAASREAIKIVPHELREAALGLGATKWSVVWNIVLPLSVPGMMTGSILALSRAMGETAPLIVVGALSYITFLPSHILSPFSALPIQIYNWVSRPQEAFLINAAAGICVLLFLMLSLNLIALFIRNKMELKNERETPIYT